MRQGKASLSREEYLPVTALAEVPAALEPSPVGHSIGQRPRAAKRVLRRPSPRPGQQLGRSLRKPRGWTPWNLRRRAPRRSVVRFLSKARGARPRPPSSWGPSVEPPPNPSLRALFANRSAGHNRRPPAARQPPRRTKARHGVPCERVMGGRRNGSASVASATRNRTRRPGGGVITPVESCCWQRSTSRRTGRNQFAAGSGSGGEPPANNGHRR
jgi:hypothetical protein